MSNELNEVPEGWYRANKYSEIERYWDGSQWTSQVRLMNSETKIFPRPTTGGNKYKPSFKIFDKTIFLAVTAVLVIVALLFGLNQFSQFQASPKASPTHSFETTTEPFFAETSGLDTTESCKISDQRIIRQQPNNVGFPLTDDLLPSQGDVNLLVVAVDFPDAPGVNDEYDYLLEQTRRITAWGDYYSQGKLNYSFQVHNGWVTVPRNSAEYVVPWTNPHTHNATIETQDQLTEDIIATLGSAYDFSMIDGLLFLFPPTIQGVEKDLGGRGGTLIDTPQGPKELFYWGGGKYHFTDTPGYIDAAGKREKLWAFWIHEMLHSQGIALHAPGNGFQTGLQGNQYGDSAALDAWELFLLGWTEDDQIHCLDRQSVTTSQVKLNSSDVTTEGTRAVIIRLSDHEALVIESRRPEGYSSSWQKDTVGILVSKVDTTLDNDRSQEGGVDSGNDPKFTKWSYLLLPDGKTLHASNPLEQLQDYLVREGSSVTYEDLKIELVFSGKQDFVKITKQ